MTEDFSSSGALEPVDSSARVAGLVAFQRGRKRDSYDRLLQAATDRFCAQGYMAVSVDDIASAAGVSRMTLYRHFSGKAALAIELFRRAALAAMPRYLVIGEVSFQDRATIIAWLQSLFAADSTNRHLLRVFNQAVVYEDSFTEYAQGLIRDIISRLGATIPAFAASPDRPDERRRWLEAWLLLFEILDQSNHAALNSGIANDPLVIDILADRFMVFVGCPA